MYEVNKIASFFSVIVHFLSFIRPLPYDNAQNLMPGEGLITKTNRCILHLLQRTLAITSNGARKVVRYGGSVLLNHSQIHFSLNNRC